MSTKLVSVEVEDRSESFTYGDQWGAARTTYRTRVDVTLVIRATEREAVAFAERVR